MIVDDGPSIRYMLCRVLVDEDYAVLSAAEGREGLKMAAANEIDLVLLDLKMPGMNGPESAAAIGAIAPRPAGHYYHDMAAPADGERSGWRQRVVAETAGFSRAAGDDKKIDGPSRRLKIDCD